MDSIQDALLDAQDVYGPTDEDWVQCIQDHKSYLLDNSSVIYLTDQEKQIFKYRSIRIAQKLNYPKSTAWIILFINDIPSDIEFTDYSSLYIPDFNTLKKLYKKYKKTAEI